jgi:hypothetical protein
MADIIKLRTRAERRVDEYQRRADEEAAERRRNLEAEFAAIASLRAPLIREE